METTNENIRQLLEMLDHPETYTEQEIHDIINRDEDTRETYRLMVEAKRSSRNRQDETPVDVDAAWQRFVEQNKTQTSILKSQITIRTPVPARSGTDCLPCGRWHFPDRPYRNRRPSRYPSVRP